jgi:hypothetical protein
MTAWGSDPGRRIFHQVRTSDHLIFDAIFFVVNPVRRHRLAAPE